jgi:hypothetical protein
MFNKRLITALVLGGLMFLLVAGGSAVAAKGGGGGHHGGGGTTTGCSTCVLSVSPNPVPLGSTGITISGSGFAAGQTIYLDLGWFPSTPVTPVDGSFSLFYAHVYTGGGNAFVNALSVSSTVLATAYYSVCFTSTC